MIKIIRLTSNQDIICDCETEETMIKVINPLDICIDRTNNGTEMIMREWMHHSLIAKNEALINPVNIICIFEPDPEVKEFYINSLKKYSSRKENLKDTNLEEMDQLMNILMEMEPTNQVMH